MLRGLHFVCGIWLFLGVLALPSIPFEGNTYESAFLHNLTTQMVSENRIETLASFGVNWERYRLGPIVSKSIEQSLMEEFQVPIVVWGLRRNISIRHLLGYKTLICVSISSVMPDVDPIFDVLNDGLVGLHYVPMLFIYKPVRMLVIPTREMLEAFFAWCWQHRFTNVFLTFHLRTPNNRSGEFGKGGRNEIYSYTPFPNLTIRNITETGYQPVDIMMDLRGYEFRVPVFQDPPTVFQLPNGGLSGSLGLMFSAYVHLRRGVLRPEPNAHVNRYNYQEHLMLAAARGEIEMGVHPYSTLQLNSSLTAGSFPLGMTNTCVLVPWQRESPQVRFMQMAAHINGTFFLILLVAMTIAWQLVHGRWRRGVHLTLVTFFQQSVPDREFHHLAEPYKIIHVALLLGSLVLWTMRTAYLSSVFTSQMPGWQINTAEDFLATPLRLMLTETEVEMYFTAGLLPSALMPRLLVVNKTTLMEHLDSLNSSYAYCTTAEHWSVVMLQQRRMYRPPFRLASNLCTTPRFLRFPVQRNSPFQLNFYRFGIHSLQFGFWAHWASKSLGEAMQLRLVVELTDDYLPIQSLTLADFKVLIKLYLLCLLGSSLCLLGEFICNFYNKYRNARLTRTLNELQNGYYKPYTIWNKALVLRPFIIFLRGGTFIFERNSFGLTFVCSTSQSKSKDGTESRWAIGNISTTGLSVVHFWASLQQNFPQAIRMAYASGPHSHHVSSPKPSPKILPNPRPWLLPTQQVGHKQTSCIDGNTHVPLSPSPRANI